MTSHARFALVSGLALALLPFCGTPAANAGNVGYNLQIFEGLNLPLGGLSQQQLAAQLLVASDCPLIVLTNTSETDQITNFSMTIGNVSYNFDAIMEVPVPGGPQIANLSPDTIQGGARGDNYSINFASFLPSKVFQMRVDIDRDFDNGLSFTNFREVLVGGITEATRAMVSVTFSNNVTITDTLSPLDGLGNSAILGSSYRCSPLVPVSGLTQSNTAVPEPGSIALAGIAGMLALAMGLRRRR